MLVISDRDLAIKVASWLERFSEKGVAEVMQLQLSASAWLTYVSRRPLSECKEDHNLIFKGFAIDYDEKSLYMGAEGFISHLQEQKRPIRGRPLEGCYLSVRWDADSIYVSNDLFALCPILYTTGAAMVAMSDSAYMLAELRRELGLRRDLNENAAIARSWLNAMAGQMLSQDTLVEQIKFLHVGRGLEISLDNRLKVEVVSRNCYEDFSVEGAGYVQGVRLAGQRMASLMKTLSGISPNVARLSISGGMDSRVCLAAALCSEVGKEQAVFSCTNTNQGHARDYMIVESLSKKFGFPLGLRGDGANDKGMFQRVKDDLGLWFLSNAGIYDYMKFNSVVRIRGGAFSITGHGAEIVKGNYGWRPIRVIADKIKEREVSAAFKAQCQAGLVAMGIDGDDKYGSEWHYLGFRNAVHSGRFVPSTMTGFRPIMNRDLVALGRSSANEWPTPAKNGQSLISDLLVYLSPELAAHPFDNPHKNLSESVVADRLKYLGVLHSDELDDYRVLGGFDDVVSGFPRVFQRLLAARGLDHPAKREVVSELIERNWRRLDGAVRDVYTSTYNEATSKVADEGLALSQMRGSVGKILAFELLA